ncbi:INO80 complex subunit D-like [Chenopodium quinoa]|uniref:INO80 complex subunit D-like n=1 Tax=Chenopodium quinoa TaxID=63459 RepID=UPI000B78DBF1|nr:INO80 complex subunit D-like [Chenopodium quinoa]
MASSSKLTKNDILSPPQPPPPPHHPPLKKPSDAINKKRKLHTSITSDNSDILSPSMDDLALSKSSHLTHQELLRRRLHGVRRLSGVYRDHYWALMEDLRVHYREYYWKYGISPCKEEDERESGGGDREFAGFNAEGCGESNNMNNNVINSSSVTNNHSNCPVSGTGGGKLGLGFGGESGAEFKVTGNNRCAYVTCRLKAMALTSFCYLHILSDPQQNLYKACNYIIKIAQQGPILCGRPILKSTVPSLCNIHFPKAQKDVKHALKKAGLNVSSSSKLAPKFHVIIAEYVNLIQSKRRAAQKHNGKSVVVKEESAC